MVSGAVVPNSWKSKHVNHDSHPGQREKIIRKRLTQIILVVPLEANLQVMVLGDHTEELIKQVSALTISQTVDVLDMMANSENGLPSSHRISANNRVLGGELAANVLGSGVSKVRCQDGTRIFLHLDYLVAPHTSETYCRLQPE